MEDHRLADKLELLGDIADEIRAAAAASPTRRIAKIRALARPGSGAFAGERAAAERKLRELASRAGPADPHEATLVGRLRRALKEGSLSHIAMLLAEAAWTRWSPAGARLRARARRGGGDRSAFGQADRPGGGVVIVRG